MIEITKNVSSEAYSIARSLARSQPLKLQNVWQQNIEEHHAFNPAIHVTWLYIRSQLTSHGLSPVTPSDREIEAEDHTAFASALDRTAPFDPDALKRHIDSFMLPLIKHLYDELETLQPKYVGLLSKDQWDYFLSKSEKDYRSFDPKWFLCSTLGESDGVGSCS